MGCFIIRPSALTYYYLVLVLFCTTKLCIVNLTSDIRARQTTNRATLPLNLHLQCKKKRRCDVIDLQCKQQSSWVKRSELASRSRDRCEVYNTTQHFIVRNVRTHAYRHQYITSTPWTQLPLALGEGAQSSRPWTRFRRAVSLTSPPHHH